MKYIELISWSVLDLYKSYSFTCLIVLIDDIDHSWHLYKICSNDELGLSVSTYSVDSIELDIAHDSHDIQVWYETRYKIRLAYWGIADTGTWNTSYSSDWSYTVYLKY